MVVAFLNTLTLCKIIFSMQVTGLNPCVSDVTFHLLF